MFALTFAPVDNEVQMAPGFDAAVAPPATGPRSAMPSIEATAIQPKIRKPRARDRRELESVGSFMCGPLLLDDDATRPFPAPLGLGRGAAAWNGRMMFADRLIAV